MEKEIIPVGAFKPADIFEISKNVGTNAKNYWKAVRPIPYKVFIVRLKMAWDVLTEKADALYWTD